MKIYDLYGIVCSDLEEARAKVESALGIMLEPHESSYHCGDYYRYNSVGQEHFILQRNYDDLEGEWMEPESQDKPFLLYVNETNRSADLQKELERSDGLKLLKHQEI